MADTFWKQIITTTLFLKENKDVELNGVKNEAKMWDKTHLNFYLYTECIDDGMEIQKHISDDGECIQCNSSEEF